MVAVPKAVVTAAQQPGPKVRPDRRPGHQRELEEARGARIVHHVHERFEDLAATRHAEADAALERLQVAVQCASLESG